MQGITETTGMVLKAEPMNDYDRRVVLLTKERGKISAFARGARKPGSRLAAPSNPFSFGVFKLYEGRSSYTVVEADIQKFFEELRTDYVGACYGLYFAEVAEWYTRENNDEREMLKLLYQSLRALCADSLPDQLVRCVFECRAIAVNGEFPGVPADQKLEESTAYALRYIAESPIEKLYTFTVSKQVLAELGQCLAVYRERYLEGHFTSLDILESLG